MDEDSLNSKNDYNKLVPAVEQAAKIIVYLCSMPGLQSNLTDIARNVGISKSKAYAILNTLQRFGFVLRNPDTKTYSVGLYMMSIGQKVLENINYRELAGPFLKELARETQSTAVLGLITGENQYVIVRQESTQQIHITTQFGQAYPLTYGAHGKAIVAFFEEGEREKVLSGEMLYFYKDPLVLDRGLLMKELEECRITGFARDHETGHPMVKILAAPLFGANGRPLGTIQIIGLIEESAIAARGARLVEAAQRFSTLLGATGKG
jgi:DNA-binding IclR family transcriptional regulator